MVERSPFVEDSSEFGVSRTAFRRLRNAEKRELMLQWFFSNFEDPAERTPYESAEGGYIWIWGGPHDPSEEVWNKFGGFASDKLIQDVVDEIQEQGFEWAPVARDSDYEPLDDEEREPASLDFYLDEPSAQYGSEADHAARLRAQVALDELAMSLVRPRPIGIGHNQPPEELEYLQELPPAVGELKAELKKANPQISSVKKWATPLRNAIIATSKWLSNKIVIAVDSGAKAAGATIAVGVVSQLVPWLANAFDAVISWLEIVAKSLF